MVKRAQPSHLQWVGDGWSAATAVEPIMSGLACNATSSSEAPTRLVTQRVRRRPYFMLTCCPVSRQFLRGVCNGMLRVYGVSSTCACRSHCGQTFDNPMDVKMAQLQEMHLSEPPIWSARVGVKLSGAARTPVASSSCAASSGGPGRSSNVCT